MIKNLIILLHVYTYLYNIFTWLNAVAVINLVHKIDVATSNLTTTRCLKMMLKPIFSKSSLKCEGAAFNQVIWYSKSKSINYF